MKSYDVLKEQLFFSVVKYMRQMLHVRELTKKESPFRSPWAPNGYRIDISESRIRENWHPYSWASMNELKKMIDIVLDRLVESSLSSEASDLKSKYEKIFVVSESEYHLLSNELEIFINSHTTLISGKDGVFKSKKDAENCCQEMGEMGVRGTFCNNVLWRPLDLYIQELDKQVNKSSGKHEGRTEHILRSAIEKINKQLGEEE